MPRKRRGRLYPFCEFCGNPIGTERGPASKTCSPECQRDRNNQREKDRYQRVKGTEEWKATRADYLGRLAERTATDPALAERLTERHRQAVRDHRAAIAADPERYAAYKQARREHWQARTPEQRAARKYWYGSLSPELRALFLKSLRDKRAAKRRQSLVLGHPAREPGRPAHIQRALSG